MPFWGVDVIDKDLTPCALHAYTAFDTLNMKRYKLKKWYTEISIFPRQVTKMTDMPEAAEKSHAKSERVFGYEDVAGQAMQYAPAADHGSRQPLTVNWPAIPAQE